MAALCSLDGYRYIDFMHASRVNVSSILTFSTVITRPTQLPIVCDSTQLSSVLQTAWNEATLGALRGAAAECETAAEHGDRGEREAEHHNPG